MTADQPVILTDPPRAQQLVVNQLATMGAATVHEAMGRIGALGPDLRPIQTGARIAGSAVTVRCWPGDNLMIHAAVEQCGPGDVLVVATAAPSTHGMFGDLFATALRYRGVIGLVIDAGVRDTADLREMGFPVWSRHVSTEGSVKATPGSVNVPVVVSGQSIDAGDIIVADDDGVVVVRREAASATLEAAKARVEKEALTRAAFLQGELGLDRYGLRQTLADLGVTYRSYGDHHATEQR
ncbi:4-hydroxy-4-methyl-2-oxoglutarate aldolase [Branchiibius hedensis]|uniref:Putative 4-hydroxy-4-methyl-2-oxoglutarate aldolase n=1 Tax=Branchiibius hedensis TaxID=672460 RepID=A0A2Y9A0F7_9MICO|nr:4-carboxy-4-hydroxy-2-oxoadipate aldolase/oxaloacetate decarboxylase [Branchiibius hedensis]PWJ26836.1 4-hydroxy-4-methyl-2-oxoglutarate aldolase [Branchiibius hedensis]SSA35647.1 4-hydroxy-4-methyl-2-oxoglutarate aldolase [Branchiibius hedensis]